ncbi:hypothetical protein PG990_009201 [Apiospora arundinis]
MLPAQETSTKRLGSREHEEVGQAVGHPEAEGGVLVSRLQVLSQARAVLGEGGLGEDADVGAG